MTSVQEKSETEIQELKQQIKNIKSNAEKKLSYLRRLRNIVYANSYGDENDLSK